MTMAMDLSQLVRGNLRLARVRTNGSLACSDCGTVVRCRMDADGLIYLQCIECIDGPVMWMGQAAA